MSIYEFYQEYFLINLSDYSNIGIDFEINKFLFVFLLGIIIATVSLYYIRSTMNLLVKRLMRKEAFSEDSALTLDELELNSTRVKNSLSSNGRITSVVARVNEKKYTYEEYIELIKNKNFSDKIDFTSARFYIKEEGRAEAEKILNTTDTPLLHTVLFCLLMIAIYICLSLSMPSILNFINDLL